MAQDTQKKFKVSWSGYPGNPKPKIVNLDWFDGMGFDDEMDQIKGLAQGEEVVMGGTFDSVTVKRVDNMKEDFSIMKLASRLVINKNNSANSVKPVTEAREYESSIDFEDDVSEIEQHFKAIIKILKSSEWKDWMQATKSNYGIDAVTQSADFLKAVNQAKAKFDKLYDDMSEAS